MSTMQHWFVGECMMEVRRAAPGFLAHAFSGDVYNTAVYFERALGSQSSCFVSAVGCDSLSDALLSDACAHGLDVSLTARVPARHPGLYWTEIDARGERTFLYWREHSAARLMLDDAHAASLRAQAIRCALLYFSGITLAILDDERRERLLDLAQHVKRLGGWIAFDSNYRPALWESTQQALRWSDAALATCTHALVTFDDERALHKDAAPEHTLARLLAAGAQDAVVKLGAEGCLAQTSAMTAPAAVAALQTEPVDTTAAGDSFNAAYLAARITGAGAEAAAQAGNALAARVVSRRGAIIDDSAS